MDRIFTTCVLILILIIWNTSGVLAQEQIGVNPPEMKWSRMNTPAGELIYPRGMDTTALMLAYRVNAAYFADTDEVLMGIDSKPITSILQNQSVFPEGYATTAPWRQELYLTPPQNMFMGPTMWRDGLTTHEYRHAQQFMAYNKGWTYLYKGLMGNTGWLLSTVLNVPLWYREGDAVDSETRFTVGGRGTVPAFHMEYRTLLLNHMYYSYEKAMNPGNYRDFVPNMYKSGYYLTRRLRNDYGDTAWAYVMDRSTGKFIYPFTRALKNLTGEKTPEYYESTFDELDSVWRTTDTVTNVIGTRISPKSGVFESYRFPQMDHAGNLIVSYSSLKVIRGFYELEEDGDLEKLITAGIYNPDHENFVVEGNRLAWAEVAYHPRYTNKTYSIIKYKNLSNGKEHQLSHRSKYFSPAPSKDGEVMAVIEYDENENCSLKVIDVDKGGIIGSFSYDNHFLTQPRWIDKNELVLITITEQGNSLLKLNISTGEWSVLLNAYDVNISKPFPHDGYVYFSSGLTGIENIYRLDMQNGNIVQVTNARFGAFDPFVHKDTVYFANYDKDGYEVWQAPLSASLDREIRFPTGPVTRSLPNYYINGVRTRIDSTVSIDTMYNSFFWNRLFTPTGWFPLIFPPELGIEIYTLNMERSFRSTIGLSYNFNEEVVQGSFVASYAKLFPVINFHLIRQGRNILQSNTEYDIDDIPEVSTTESIIGGGLELPLRLTQGVHNTNLNMKGSFDYHLINESFEGGDSYDFKSLTSELSFIRSRPRARRQVKTRFAQLIQTHIKRGNGEEKPEQIFANGHFFFPGLFKTHSLNFRSAFEANDNIQPYRYLSVFKGSRGYRYYPFEEVYLVSGNYELPLLYPDVYLRAFAGVSRVRFNAFFDYAKGNTAHFEQLQRSYGGELIFDLRFLRAFNMDLALQFIQRMDNTETQKPFMFNITVNYFELLN